MRQPVKQGYAFGYIAVVSASLGSIFSLFHSAIFGQFHIELFILGIPSVAIAVAAAQREAWGWYVLLSALGVNFVFSMIIALIGLPAAPKAFLLPLARALVSILWFAYFYKRRAMFGAKSRWRWFETTFPQWVGPEEEPTATVTEATSLKQSAAIYSPKPEIPLLTKRCPSCAETINVEALECPYCKHTFGPEKVATAIRQVLNKLPKRLVTSIDFSSMTKTCPKCAETIKIEAIVCRYCRHEFTYAVVEMARVSALRAELNRVYEIPGGVEYGTRCPRCNYPYFAKVKRDIYQCDSCGARFKCADSALKNGKS